jgi:hypothetical protein
MGRSFGAALFACAYFIRSGTTSGTSRENQSNTMRGKYSDTTQLG